MAINSAWDVGASSISSPVPIIGLIKGLTGIRQSRMQRSAMRRQAQYRVNNAQRGLDQFNQNAPIQQARLQQSLASRGLGTSSIQEQDTSNLTATQARQRAALGENLDLAIQGKNTMNSQFKFARRMGPLTFYEALLAKTQQALGQMMGGGMPGMGGEGGGDAGGFSGFQDYGGGSQYYNL